MRERREVMFLLSGLDRGGTEVKILDLARRLPDTIGVHVCATSSGVALQPAFADAGARVTVIPVNRPWRDWSAVRSIATVMRDSGAAVLNTFDLKGALIAWAICRVVTPRPALVHHQVDLQFGLSHTQRRVLTWLMQRADAIVCDARTTVDVLFGDTVMRPPIRVIPNGVDLVAYSPDASARADMRRSLGVTDEHFLIGTVANFRPEKNHRLLIDAFGALYREFPQLRLVCIGGGPLLEEMRSVVATRQLADVVTFTGSVEDVHRHLAALDTFVLPSLRETLSNAVLQAMATGVPCVCSRIGECQTLMMGDQNGILFDPTDLASCIAAIRRVVVDRDLRRRLASEGRTTVEREYSTETMVTAYAQLLRTIGVASTPLDRRAG